MPVGYTAPRGGVPDSLKLSALHDCSAVAAIVKTVATFVNMRRRWRSQSALLPFQRLAIPLCKGRCRLVGRLQESQQGAFRICCVSHRFIGKNKFTELAAIESLRGRHFCIRKAVRSRISIGVKNR